MGVHHANIQEEVQKVPMNQDLTILEKELIAILANITTTLRGGNYGRAGILMDPARYLLTAGVPFANSANPGRFPVGVP
jgi:hypothetical protein